MGQFAVIGLGRFGSATSLELMRLGHSVLGVDADGRVVDQMADKLTRAAIADVTDRDTLAELGLAEYDVVLVAIGEGVGRQGPVGEGVLTRTPPDPGQAGCQPHHPPGR